MPPMPSLPVYELPQNPNGVVFSAAASEVLKERNWWDVLELIRTPLRVLSTQSGLDCVAHVGWRVAVGRRNDRIPMLLVAFVFDGPATAGHFSALESAMAHSAQRWSPAQIERIPPNCPPVLAQTKDELFVVWSPHADGARRPLLQKTERGVVLHWDGSLDASERFGSGVLAKPPDRSSHNLDFERQRLAFAHHYTQRIIEADGVVREEEEAFMRAVFPALLFERLGIGEDATVHESLERARRSLPEVLGHHDKLAMIGLFFSACYSDGALDAREMRVLGDAGGALGLSREQIVGYLERLW